MEIWCDFFNQLEITISLGNGRADFLTNNIYGCFEEFHLLLSELRGILVIGRQGLDFANDLNDIMPPR